MDPAGTSLPGGTYRISRAENDALCASIGAAVASDDRAHPIFYYIATQVGMGISVADLLALCDFDVADGPLMVGSKANFSGELLVERDYAVSGRIVSMVRKSSRAFGAMDLMTFTLLLQDEGGDTLLSCTNQWVLPRKGESA